MAIANTTYCTYLTTYSGNLMPMWYIGSSSIKKIDEGYRGSVVSKKYKLIWQKELKQNPHLFKTKIISTHLTDKEARNKELKLHKSLNVVKSTMYINQSYASVNGFFGMDVSGEKNPNYGKKHSGETLIKQSKIKKGKQPWNKGKVGIYNEFTLKKMSECKSGENHPNYGKNRSEETKKKIGLGNLGKKHSQETNEKNRLRMLSYAKKTCEHCTKTLDSLNYSKWHGDKCKVLLNG